MNERRAGRRTVLVTGANAGIGRAACEALARRGARVVMACRSRERGEAARREIVAAGGHDAVDLLVADLAVTDQVRALAAEVRARYDRLDALVNNAGVYVSERRLTPDGHEQTWAVNHLAPFVLTTELLGLLAASAPSRVVTVSSDAHRGARELPLDDLRAEQGYRGMQRYAESKLANVLFTRELARRLDGTGITALAMHPGMVGSRFWHQNDNLLSRVMRLFRPLMTRPATSGEAVARLALDPAFADAQGGYFKLAEPARPAPQARDDRAARRLWKTSEAMTGGA